MPEDAPRPAQAAIRTDLGAIFVSLELSRKTWLITSLSPGGGEKMSKHSVPAGEVSGLLRRFAELRRKAAARTGRDFPIIAAVLWSEGLFRQFDNRRQVAAYAGLAPTPWQSGSIDHEQGVSKAGNPRLRTTMVELAWLWLQN
jgi:Transposase IS116/IS110/IS902 family